MERRRQKAAREINGKGFRSLVLSGVNNFQVYYRYIPHLLKCYNLNPNIFLLINFSSEIGYGLPFFW